MLDELVYASVDLMPPHQALISFSKYTPILCVVPCVILRGHLLQTNHIALLVTL